MWSYDCVRDAWREASERKNLGGRKNFISVGRVWVGGNCVPCLFQHLVLSWPLCEPESSRCCFWATGRLGISPSVYGTWVTTERCVPLQSREWLRREGIWFSKYEVRRQFSHSLLLFPFTGLKNIHKGENLAWVAYEKVGNDTLAKLDHPYALAVEVPARNVYTTRGGQSGALGTELPWLLRSQWSVYHWVQWKVKSEWL